MKNEIREQQRKTWNKFSAGWKKQDKFVMEWLQPIGEKILDLAMLREDYRVLDVATGTGEPGLTAATKTGKGQVVGVDIAEDMVQIAKEKARILKIKNFETQQCDESALPFGDNYFDAIICRFGVIYFPNMFAGLREMYRVLKSGKRFSLSAWAEPEKNPWATTAAGIVNKMLELKPPPPDMPGIFRCAKPGTLTSLLNQSGFKKISETEITGEVVFDSPEDYWKFIIDVVAPVSTALSSVNEKMREKVRLATIKAAEQNVNNGKTSFNWSSWVASGIK